ncbi:MAG: zinc-binding dehydrogenase [Chloroflexi bacterium]|nr:zinc-binding dehydrogenase [Chloroflexota bacterium]
MDNRAVVVDPTAAERLAIQSVAVPVLKEHEALVRMAATSLNLGEVRRSTEAPAGTRLGWDVAGTVAQAAADGSGPRQGSRVVGLLTGGAWAELVAVPTHSLAELPEAVSFSQAATLPVAGLTALHAVEHGSGLLARRVLVTGASGGVGSYACQIARLMGADVVGLVHQEKNIPLVEQIGIRDVVASPDGADLKAYGPFCLVVDLVGGRVLTHVVGWLAPDGLCVCAGAAAGSDPAFSILPLTRSGRASIYGLRLFDEFTREPAAQGLGRLSRLVAEGRLRPLISVEASWSEIGKVARQLLDRQIAGKAVIRVDG